MKRVLNLPTVIIAVSALVAATLAVKIVLDSRKRAAVLESMRLRELVALAEWVDSTAGTPEFPAPGSVSFYTLWPLAVWPVEHFPPNTRMDGRCPLPEHDLRVVAPITREGVVWAATCQKCAAHWTAKDAPPPVVVAEQIERKLEAFLSVRR
jgi:hypothetical protein